MYFQIIDERAIFRENLHQICITCPVGSDSVYLHRGFDNLICIFQVFASFADSDSAQNGIERVRRGCGVAAVRVD